MMERTALSFNFIQYGDVTDHVELEAIHKILNGCRVSGKIELPWLPKPPDVEPIEYVEHIDNLSFAEIDDSPHEPIQEADLSTGSSVNGDTTPIKMKNEIFSRKLEITSTPITESQPEPANAPTEVVTSPEPSAAPKSWSALFSPSAQETPFPLVVYETDSPSKAYSASRSKRDSAEVKQNKPTIDSSTKEFIDGQKPNLADIMYQIRGMINSGNWCYITSILQAMLACPPMHHFLRSLKQIVDIRNKTQATKSVLSAMVWLVNQCAYVAHSSQTKSHSGKVVPSYQFHPGDPLDPSLMYDILPKMHRSAEGLFMQGVQEDAEEFLTSLLNTLHEEINSTDITKVNAPDKFPAMNGEAQNSGDDDGEDWHQVGRKQRSVITRTNQSAAGHSAISRIFQGLLRSSLYTTKESSTLEPFFTIPLNLRNAKGKNALEEALPSFLAREKIEGYKADDGRSARAWRQLRFEELPSVMVIHLKCFIYEESGPQKILHDTRFNSNLVIQKEWMSSQVQHKHRHESSRSYQLFAVVYHTGEKASGGHYTSSVRYKALHGKPANNWVYLDDVNTKPITEYNVLHPERPTVPYLLFYRKR